MKINVLMALFAALLLCVIGAQASPIVGSYDSRADPAIIVDGDAYWYDSSMVGLFMAGSSGASPLQWYIEASDPEQGWENYGIIQLYGYSDAPWFGDDTGVIGGYEGSISSWSLTRDFTYDEYGEIANINLLLTGTAVLDQYRMQPLSSGSYTAMPPVTIQFELGFDGTPVVLGHYYDNGIMWESPDYLTVTVLGNGEPVPEPASLTLLGAGILGLAALRYRKHRLAG